MSDVVYHSCGIPDFQGNPLIEALPRPISARDLAKALIEHPGYDSKCRSVPQEERRLLTQVVTQFYQPGSKDIELFEMVDRSLRWGYAWRNPLSPYYRLRFGSGAPLESSGAYYVPYIPTTGGFALLGISGLGKTSAIRKILSLYPQVISHRNYNGIHFQETQVVWIHLDMPKDGSLKGLSSSFFAEIDRCCGTNFSDQYNGKRTTLDTMLQGMTKVAASTHVGIIVLDEIQNLCTTKNNDNIPQKALNFIVTMINSINVPVVMVGTPRALSFFQKEFQQAKRASAQGAALWERMNDDVEWNTFVHAMWVYQYTSQKVPLTEELSHKLYEESLGIPFLAVQIYKLTQEKAMASGRETFDGNDFHIIASGKMGLTKPMVESLRSGKDINLKAFLDLSPFTTKDYQSLYPDTPSPAAPPQTADKKTVQQKAISTMLGLGLTNSDAKHFVNLVLAKHPDCQSDTVIAREAYAEYLKKETAPKEENKDESSDGPVVVEGYEQNLSNGLIGL